MYFKKIHDKHVKICATPLLFQAQLLDLRSDLLEVRATKSILEKELQTMLLQLHSSQLQLQEKMGHNIDSETIKKKLVSTFEGVGLLLFLL